MAEEEKAWKEMRELIEKIKDDFDKGNFSDLANSLIELIHEIEKNILEILPVADEIVKLETKAGKYLNEKGAEHYQEILATAKKYKEAKALHLFAEFEALQNAGFKRKEAMEILIKMPAGNQKSMIEQIVGIIIAEEAKEGTETFTFEKLEEMRTFKNLQKDIQKMMKRF